MNLVVGATGRLGSAICRLLAVEGKPFRALVRSVSDPATVGMLRDLDAKLANGDLCAICAAKDGKVTAVYRLLPDTPKRRVR